MSGSSGTRKRRTRSPHPGIVLIKPEAAGRHPAWRARYTDPDSGRVVKVRLDPVALPTTETRRDWAIRKSKALAKRRMDLEAGAPVHNRTSLDDAVKEYLRSCEHRLRPRTLALYRQAIERFVTWGRATGVRATGDLTTARLADLRDHLLGQRRQAIAKGGKRGTHKQTPRKLSPHTINWQLRAIKSLLNHWRLHGLVPGLDRDGISDALKPLSAPHERIEFLSPAELQRLLKATLRHDAAVFAETRDEHAGLRPVGTTSRYEPIAPFVATVLLTGMRLGEALSLDWKQVDLDALDHDGRKVGEIHLTSATKTKRARMIDLGVSPALHRLLAPMHLASGGEGRVFAQLTEAGVNAARTRLRTEFGAPESFGWQVLRRTTGTYLTNAPGIFGAASAYRSARQLGHSVAVAEKHYLGVTRGIPRDARTLEDAMQVADLVNDIAGGAPRRATEAT